MTLINVETGEIVADISADDARQLTDRIKVSVEVAWDLITQAYSTRAWSALGYSTWDDYCTREFGSARLRLPREDRQEVVASLREQGLSIRAIAAATGNSKNTIADDVSQIGTPDTAKPDPRDAYDAMRDAMVSANKPKAPERAKVTGTDGKSYEATPRTKPGKPKRGSLPDAAQKAGWEFRKAVERIERIGSDDRFAANKEQVAAHLHGHLSYALEVCQDLLDQLDHQS